MNEHRREPDPPPQQRRADLALGDLPAGIRHLLHRRLDRVDVTTVHIGQHTTRREHTVIAERGGPSPVYARLDLEDSQGHRQFEIVRDSITVGRGGIAFPVDLRVSDRAACRSWLLCLRRIRKHCCA
jgi:hypothetical protein